MDSNYSCTQFFKRNMLNTPPLSKKKDDFILEERIIKGLEKPKNQDSIFTSFISPLYKRKVDIPQMKYTGGSYNKILKRF